MIHDSSFIIHSSLFRFVRRSGATNRNVGVLGQGLTYREREGNPMAYDLTEPLVIGIGSRALFDLE